MPNLNKVMLMGNLTRDPELRYTPNNQAVANIGMAINRTWFNKQTNEKQEETTFVDCEAWGRTAEVINQYLKKGRPIYIEGRLKLDQWQDKDGGNRSKLKVVVENFQFIDSRGGEGGGAPGGGYEGGSAGQSRGQSGGQAGGQSGGQSGGAGRAAPAGAGAAPAHQPVDEDDIPF
jgi:single-strand DNA-binding protein